MYKYTNICTVLFILPSNRIDFYQAIRRIPIIQPVYQYSRTRRWRKFQKGKIYNSEEHVPIESFVTTLIHWTFFLMMRTKLAFVGFVAAGSSMWDQVLDDLCLVVTHQSATTCDSSYEPNSTQYNSVLQSSEKCYPSTILYYKVLLQKVLLQYYKVLLQYYSVLQSTSPVLLRTTKYYSSTSNYCKVLV